VQQVPTLQRLHEEEAQRRDVEADRQRSPLPLAQQIRLVRSDVCLIQPVGPALEVSSELLDGVQIRRERRGERSYGAGAPPAWPVDNRPEDTFYVATRGQAPLTKGSVSVVTSSLLAVEVGPPPRAGT